MPPAINIIAIANFAASLSARALDPVLPHVADEFGISIAAAASFCGGVCVHLCGGSAGAACRGGHVRQSPADDRVPGDPGFANMLGALSTSFPLLFASRILAGIGSGGVFPVALGLTSDLVGSRKRQVAIGRTLAGSMTGNLLGASFSGVIGDFLGWRGVLADSRYFGGRGFRGCCCRLSREAIPTRRKPI